MCRNSVHKVAQIKRKDARARRRKETRVFFSFLLYDFALNSEKSLYLFIAFFLLKTEFVVNVLKVRPRLDVRAAWIYLLTTLFKIGS